VAKAQEAGEALPPLEPGKLKGAKRSSLPRKLEPQLATHQDKAPGGSEWLHEIKLDGYRALVHIENGTTIVRTRTGLDWTDRFKPLAGAANALPVSAALLDGEVVAADPTGRTSLAGLQQVLTSGKAQDLVYYVFDLLHLDGWDLSGAPLEARKDLLRDVLARGHGSRIRFSDHQVGRGPAVLEAACRMGLEGIVSKRRDAPYKPGRGRGWIKCKCSEREDFVIGGYTKSSVGAAGIGSLAAGYWDGDHLIYAGRVGSGFTADTAVRLYQRLSKLNSKTVPFAELPALARKGMHWVHPEQVCEVSFLGWTSDGCVRGASFAALRDDKEAKEVTRATVGGPKAAPPSKRRAGEGKAEAAPADVIAGIAITHPDRVLYAQTGLTKRGLAQFYAEIAPWVLPHVVDRPLSIVRCPDGAGGQCFYQKHAGVGWPKGIHGVPIEEKDGKGLYIYISDLTGLMALVQMGVLEFHPWGARRDDVERPDRVIFDLDPDPSVPWERVIETAVACRDRLEALGLQSFVKTTGGKGLHVVVPLARRHEWPEVKAFAMAFAQAMMRDADGAYTINMSKAARHGKIFLDYLRNDRGSTAVAAYTTRVKPNAPVATPLAWSELSPAIRSDHFTVETLPRRLARLHDDPWEGMDKLQQTLTAKLRRALDME
jgi:bifunctional non-homologous end joining protein LigD